MMKICVKEFSPQRKLGDLENCVMIQTAAAAEVFATTGTRMRVRVFGGWDFTENDLHSSDFAKHGYDGGVPMGGDLKAAPSGKAPAFLV